MVSRQNSILKIFFTLVAIGSTAALIGYLSLPSDEKSAWLLGFSRSRAILILGCLLLSISLAWLAYGFIRETTWAEKTGTKISNYLEQPIICWSILIASTLMIVGGVWILWQWNFASSDQQIRAYLERLTPLVLFTSQIGVQLLAVVWISFFSDDQRKRWLFVLFLLGGYIVFLWLLVGEYFLADRLFPQYFVAKRYSQTLQSWLPWTLFQTTLFIQAPYLLRKQLRLRSNYYYGAFLLLALLMGYFYYQATLTHALEVNTNISAGDQQVYVDFIRRVSESGFRYSGVRNQTPGYSYLQAMFCHADLNDQDLFECGKRVNIILSMVLLSVSFGIFRRFLSFHQSFTLTILVAFFVFIFKAGYLKAELVFYFASFICFLLMCGMLIRPSIWLGLGTGLTLGLTYYLKASVLPAIALFTLIFLVKEIQFFSQAKNDSKISSHTQKNLASLVLTGIVFTGVLFPYLYGSKQQYGGYFYNLNSTYYIWYDSFDEAKIENAKLHFDLGQPDLPPEQLPSLKKYLREHSASQIWARFFTGLRAQFLHFWQQIGVFNYLIFYALILVFVFFTHFSDNKPLLKTHLLVFSFVILYTLGYVILFAWYDPIAGGLRFTAGLFLPLLFSAFVSIKTLTDQRTFVVAKHSITLNGLFEGVNALVIAMLAFDAYVIIAQILPNGYFGA